MEVLMKTHAKDYLMEICEASTTEDWLKALISQMVMDNGTVDSEVLDKIYAAFKSNSSIEHSELHAVNSPRGALVKLKKLRHGSGVCALKGEQCIVFSPSITIVYGLNGSGKSSYFRILNELVGGGETKKVLQNIFIESPSSIDVSLEYDLDGVGRQIAWDGKTRAIEDLSSCRVFDSSYSKSILQQHPLDEVLILPMGLYLFQKISDVITDFKSKISAEIEQLSRTKPILDTSFFSDNTKQLFTEEHIPITAQEDFLKKGTFSKEDQAKLDDLLLRLENLKRGDWDSKRKLKNSYILKLNSFIDNINGWRERLSSQEKQVVKTIESYNEQRAASDKHREQMAVISQIPGASSSTWKEFVKTGLAYDREFGNGTVCPYCRQKLSADALLITNAYVCFLNDQTALELQKTEQTLNKLYSVISNYNYDLLQSSCDEACAVLSDEETFSESMKADCYNFIQECLDIKSSLLQAIQLKNKPSHYKKINIDSTVAFIRSIGNKFRDDIKQLEIDERDNAILIKHFSDAIEDLQERKSIFCQVVKIKKVFTIGDEMFLLSSRTKKLSTRLITDKANQASQDLLTEALRDRFNDELKRLGFDDFYVKLERGPAKKGVPTTKLSLLNNGELNTVLSEGEQKAVSFSLFLAEARTQGVPAPIILDDPVNSLDHKIAYALAERLMDIENQVIIFTHNKLFMDAFETSRGLAHICKNMNGGCNSTKGRHIFAYCVESEERNSKGVLCPFKGRHASDHINAAKESLFKSPVEDKEKIAIQLRLAIECIIDEVIFNNLSPIKYNHKNCHIEWDCLKKLAVNSELVDLLHRIHDRVSGGVLHTGYEAGYNSISVEEFKKMTSDLERIITS